MNIKQLLISSLFFLYAAFLSGQQAALEAALADTALTGTSWSICITDVSTGETVFEYDAERNLAPASVTKLYPTAAALSLLGHDYCFKTELLMTGEMNKRRGILEGNIIIYGCGDPCLGSPYFSDHYGDVIDKWVSALKEAGVLHVKGRVAASESIYDFNPVPGGWSWADLGNYYGAGVYDINFNDNTYNIYVTGHSEGTPATIDSISLFGREMQIKNYLTSSGTSDRGYVYNSPYSYDAWISGSVPADRSIILKASMPDPPGILMRHLTERLRAAGIKVDGNPTDQRIDIEGLDITPVVITVSPPVSEIIKVINHESVNMYADQLRKHLGYYLGESGSFGAGTEVIKDFLDSAGCDPDRALMLDGSGLSPNNGISARLTAGLLVYMYNSKDSAIFLSSLPAAGVSGTMKNYFRSELFNGRVIAKTGSITGVRAFGGYVTTQGGKTMAFTMIANGFTAPWREVTDRMEKIIEELILSH
ncbi:MAG: D-alanyl-D-alanine carboxypeptidase/D-alanyl-D-alanine-endopeptidase [Bacteroidales bacterium]|jgi:D-alanyl-D-alanine carboxypeptidase/D-alanyl-D-alanine-endopeptidase (penicillin-binding protein 4)|nr:D-alanyl-D-alanine carboxypeptidase/D-alanyl-D-alanine-endopeptidase [Bacteroidales bacterium]